jgi:RNA-binding protein
MPLDGKRKRALRARGHHLPVAVTVGASGVTAALLAEAERALDDHELVKLRLAAGDRALRAECLARICEALGAEHVQSIGRTALVFREHPPGA